MCVCGLAGTCQTVRQEHFVMVQNKPTTLTDNEAMASLECVYCPVILIDVPFDTLSKICDNHGTHKRFLTYSKLYDL